MDVDRKEYLKEVGQRLKTAREKTKFSRRDVSWNMGFSPNVYGYYENGTYFPKPETLIYFSKKLNVSMDWLLLGKGPEEYEAKKELADLEAENRELKKEIAQIKQSNETLPPMSPEMIEMAKEMNESLTLFHEMMLHYNRYKEGNTKTNE
jgi:transcriptional regulator with XRE-family HTH domain